MEKEKIQRANQLLKQINMISATIEKNKDNNSNMYTYGDDPEFNKLITVIKTRRYEEMKQNVFADLEELREKIELELNEL